MLKNKDIKYLSNIKHVDWMKKEKLYLRDPSIGFDKKAGIKNLTDIKGILDGENITFWLTFGTLLGAIREKDFIEYDDDIDFMAYNENIIPKYDILKNKFIEKGFIFRDWQKKRGTKINLYRYKQLCTIDGLILDMAYKNNKYRLANRWRFPKKYFETYGEIKFQGMTFRVPSPPEDFLSFLYRNWKKPIDIKILSQPDKWRNKKIRQDKK